MFDPAMGSAVRGEGGKPKERGMVNRPPDITKRELVAMKAYVVWGEVRRKPTPEAEGSRPWKEDLCTVTEQDLKEANETSALGGNEPWDFTDEDVLGNFLTARAVRIVENFNSTRRAGEQERELVRSWVEETEVPDEPEDDEGSSDDTDPDEEEHGGVEHDGDYED